MKNIANSPFSLRLKGELAASAIKVAGALPLTLSQYLGMLLGKLMLRINTREVKIARRNLEICFPNDNLEKRESLLRASFLHGGMQIFEIAFLWRNDAQKALKLINEVEGKEVLDNAIQKKQGILLILPHLGNWELANAYLLQQMEMVAMYSPSQLPAVEKLMREGRQRTGLKLAEASPRGVIKLIKTLNEGGNLTILPDQEPPQSGGEFSPFFNKEALTMTLISKMLRKSNATPVIACVYRKSVGKGFKIIFRDLDVNVYHEDLRTSLSALNLSVENVIKEFPEQYMWGYKRFRKRPSGEGSLYKDLQ